MFTKNKSFLLRSLTTVTTRRRFLSYSSPSNSTRLIYDASTTLNETHNHNHSHTRPPLNLNILLTASEASPKHDIPSQILQAALKLVSQYGFSTKALEEGAKSLGYPSITHGIFSRGSINLISYFMNLSKEEMKQDLLKMDFSNMKTTAKVRAGIVSRLEKSKPIIRKWPEAAAELALPRNLDIALRGIGELVDEIWYLAGDRSVDMNWYSKRALLAGVYTSTEMYMTQDFSPGFQETYAFLDRRLGDVATLGKGIMQLRNGFDFAFKVGSGLLESQGFRFPL